MNPGLAWFGIFLAGLFAGGFAIPAKKIEKLHWDQTWLVYCIVALLLLPLGLALAAIPGLLRIYGQNGYIFLLVLTNGAGWGFGAYLFGMSIPRLGFALANAIVNGVVTLVGSLAPLVIGASRIDPGQGLRLTAGLGLLMVGIGFCSWASVLRDRGERSASGAAPSLAGSIIGIALAVLSGVLSAMLNTAFAYGEPLIAKAGAAGVVPAAATLAVWVPALGGGFLVNAIATAWKIGRARDWKNCLEATPVDWLRASSLGFLWFGSVLAYGISSLALGSGGIVYGWAVYGGVAILASTAWGFATGEWKQAGPSARAWVVAGVLLFIIAFAILAKNT